MSSDNSIRSYLRGYLTCVNLYVYRNTEDDVNNLVKTVIFVAVVGLGLVMLSHMSWYLIFSIVVRHFL